MTHRRCLTAVLLLVALAAACSRKDAASPADRDSGGVAVPGVASARLFDTTSDRGVVIAIDGADVAAWTPVAEEIARSGYWVIVVPAGGQDPASAVKGAAETLTRRGARRLVFVGSGGTVAAALAGAAADGAGVALLNPPAQPDQVPAGGMPAVPSLMMASLTDGGSSAAAQALYRAAPEPRTLALYPAREPAPAAFAANPELKASLLDFIRNAFQPLSAAIWGHSPMDVA